MLARFLAVIFYTALGVIVLGFIFSNREIVEVTIPLIAQVTMSLYVTLALTFGLGLSIGLSYAALLTLKAMRRERQQRRAIAALEKEVASKPNS